MSWVVEDRGLSFNGRVLFVQVPLRRDDKHLTVPVFFFCFFFSSRMLPFFTSNETSSWLLYILTDSALPTGGFVSSSGLEASYQAGLVDNTNLPAFVSSSAHNFASNSNCFVRAGYEAVDHSDPLAFLSDGDATCDAVTAANAVAKRASLAQGIAMLTLFLKCFSDTSDQKDNVQMVKSWKNRIRAEKADGHFAICFGLICRCLKVDLGRNENRGYFYRSNA